jgi:hypothetical protein
MSPSTEDDLPVYNPLGATTANTLAPSAGIPGAAAPSSSASGAAGSSAAGSSGGSLFGTRGIAIVLGLISIFGAILLFLGDDISGAVRIASKVAE